MRDQRARSDSGFSALDDGLIGPSAALGWDGVTLPELSLFGCRLVPVVVVIDEIHRVRHRDGDGPELDSDTLTLWEWPQSTAPAPAVRLSGALFPSGRGFRRALTDARRWRPFGPSAVVAPAPVVADQVSRWECALDGVGLAPAEPGPATVLDVVSAEGGRRAPARRRTIDRWIEESLYAHVLAVGLL